ncbi:alpha/beta hydrolase [Halorhodospira halophila]|uniref:Dienelactone hydrolase n=1 Tax=Halorhodospira halophila (strain DSM 244 / SL1) TaxID=349124 RepID=A1WXH9_HALHL|nr:alpha/beta fold hydrolase [Halorhodospira halophila]ABM62391.1 dienelactone hydrolase [Halorhodospira halophila SL1]MBK1729521.1 hypothetical protein [Halorhodospira halophila]
MLGGRGTAWRDLGLAGIALAAIGLALYQLLSDEAGIEREALTIDQTPATIYRPAAEEAGPVVLVSHGFAGSRPLMEPFALTLAGNGYTVVSFDYLGHGRNPRPLHGDITAQDGAAQALVDQTERVAEYVRAELMGEDDKLAVLGHSMASNIIVRFAQQRDDVLATVGVSMFAPTVDAETPGNLMSVVGGFERRLQEEGQRVVAMAFDDLQPEEVEIGRTYGDFPDGTARRIAVAPGVEHVAVLYSQVSLEEAVSWLDQAFGRDSERWVAARGPWVALLLAAVIALARPGARLLPRVSAAGRGAGAGWRRLAVVAGIPALATPLLLAPVPTDFLPVVIGDYVAIHFALFGALSAALLWWTAGRPGPRGIAAAIALGGGAGRRWLLGAAAVIGYCLLVLGAVLDQFVTVFYPAVERLPLLLAMVAGTLPYFLADEWLTRGQGMRRGVYPATKVLFLVSLGLAVALDPDGLFFLLLIVPVVLVFFLVYGLFSRWVYRHTGHPLVAGLANAVAFAWALGVTFPMLGGAAG